MSKEETVVDARVRGEFNVDRELTRPDIANRAVIA